MCIRDRVSISWALILKPIKSLVRVSRDQSAGVVGGYGPPKSVSAAQPVIVILYNLSIIILAVKIVFYWEV